MNQKRFLAELIFRLHDNLRPSICHFEKFYFPLKAASEKEAYQIALIKASSELDNRKDYTKEYLQWEFIGLESLAEIEKIRTSSYHHAMNVPKDISAYIHSLRKQNASIQLRLTENP